MSLEILGLDAYLMQALGNDVTILTKVGGRVYADQAPQKDPNDPNNQAPIYPIVIYAILSSPDTLGAGAVRVLTSPLFHVSVIGEGGGYGDIAPIADAIDALFRNTGPQTIPWQGTTYTLLGIYRTGSLQRASFENGVRYNWLTLICRADIQAS